jgi:hypothetical protein
MTSRGLNPVSFDPRYWLRYGTVMVPPRPRPAPSGRARSAGIEDVSGTAGAAGAGVAGGVRYRGVRVWRTPEGWRVSIDPESLFDSYREAKRFIDFQARNPLFRRGGWEDNL